jgi:5-methylcytosine-specific restriction endonuclease McrA
MEHIIAEKHRGSTEAENLALACPYCNRAKANIKTRRNYHKLNK